jgi:hypothetical protein
VIIVQKKNRTLVSLDKVLIALAGAYRLAHLASSATNEPTLTQKAHPLTVMNLGRAVACL